MKTKEKIYGSLSVLDVAIYAGLTAVFLAAAVPLVRGAVLRKRTAECASKIMWAANAFDSYAAAKGDYPPNSERGGTVRPCREMDRLFHELKIDWWDKSTELGGAWDWFSDDQRGFVAIANPRASERCMRNLDRLIDDGNLDAGVFRRYGSVYCYILKKRGRLYADS